MDPLAKRPRLASSAAPVHQRLMANHDVLREIALHCPIQGQLILSVTSTQWRAAVHSINKARKVINVRDTLQGFHNLTRILRHRPEESIEKFVEFIPTVEGQRKNIARTLERIKEMFPKLHSLRNISTFDPRGPEVSEPFQLNSSIQQEIMKFESLTCLELRNFESVCPDDFLNVGLSRIGPQLTEFRFNCFEEGLLAFAPFAMFGKLEILELGLQFNDEIQASDSLSYVFKFLEDLPKPEILKEFEIRGLGNQGFHTNSYDRLGAFVGKCKQLVSLSVAPVNIALSINALCVAVGNLKHLRNLAFEISNNLNRNDINNLFRRSLLKVESIRIIVGDAVSCETVQGLVKSVMTGRISLKEFHVSPKQCGKRYFYCTTRREIDCKSAPNLESLSFSESGDYATAFVNLPSASIRSFFVSGSIAKWDCLSDFENLEHLDMEFGKLGEGQTADWVFTNAYPKLRYLTLRRSFEYNFSVFGKFGAMVECVGPWLVGLKISQRIVCSKNKERYIDKVVNECKNLEYLGVFLEFEIPRYGPSLRSKEDRKKEYLSFFKHGDFSVSGLAKMIEKCPKLRTLVLPELLQRLVTVPDHINVKREDKDWPPLS